MALLYEASYLQRLSFLLKWGMPVRVWLWIFVGSAMCLISCSFLLPDPSPEIRKSPHYAVNFSARGWKSLSDHDSDLAFMEEKSGDVLLVNSACQKYQQTELSYLAKKAVSHLEHLEILSAEEQNWNDRKAVRLAARGELDGVRVFMELLTTRRNHCFYDFIYISTKGHEGPPSEALDKLLQSVSFQ